MDNNIMSEPCRYYLKKKMKLNLLFLLFSTSMFCLRPAHTNYGLANFIKMSLKYINKEVRDLSKYLYNHVCNTMSRDISLS